jgi:hypothetical protein
MMVADLGCWTVRHTTSVGCLWYHRTLIFDTYPLLYSIPPWGAITLLTMLLDLMIVLLICGVYFFSVKIVVIFSC